MKMTAAILMIVALGILTGYTVFPAELKGHIETIIAFALYLVIFLIGISIGRNRKIFKELRKMGHRIILLPIGTFVGSLIGGLVAGFIVSRGIFVSLAIASGFGWYSLSFGLLTNTLGTNNFGLEVGTIGFLANVFREMLAFVFIPIVAKKISPYAAISIGGATTMDTTLPLVTKSTNEKFAVVSFIHGAFISLIVPILVPFFANLAR